MASTLKVSSSVSGRAAIRQTPARRAASVVRCSSSSRPAAEQQAFSRRDAMQMAIGGACLTTMTPLAARAEKTPKGFVGLRDKGDGYQFFYPFGWQEVSIPGQDIVYKDVIEPLESISVSLIDTDKASISDYGDVTEVCYTLADKVLTAPNQTVELIQAKEDEFEGIKYYNMEFKVTASNYSRHALAAITVNNGKFYTLLTGCNERRWKKVAPKLKDMVGSFSTFTIIDV